MNVTPKEKIEKMQAMRAEGNSFAQIAQEFNCSIYTIKYHLLKNRKEKAIKSADRLKNRYALAVKRRQFLGREKGVKRFTLEELKEKIGNDPRCYLTNDPIDLEKPSTYSLDHIHPACRGGKSELINAGLIRSDVNLAKYDRTVEEFLDLCRRVLINNGYEVIKK